MQNIQFVRGDYQSQFPRLISLQSELSKVDGKLDYVIDKYLEWVNFPEYLVFKQELENFQNHFKIVKCAKRGNDVYRWRVRKKFSGLFDVANYYFFREKDRSGKHFTQLLFVTLTFARGVTLDDCWRGIGREYNRFISALRRRYGRINVLRTWESHVDGYPHIHMLCLFEDREFLAFHYRGKWRIEEKDEIVRYWNGGFADVQACGSLKDGLKYVLKYVKKNIDSNAFGSDKKTVQTLALCWVFRKRSFSVSGAWILYTRDLIRQMHNSNRSWVLLGFLGGFSGAWSEELSVSDWLSLKSKYFFKPKHEPEAQRVYDIEGVVMFL